MTWIGAVCVHACPLCYRGCRPSSGLTPSGAGGQGTLPRRSPRLATRGMSARGKYKFDFANGALLNSVRGRPWRGCVCVRVHLKTHVGAATVSVQPQPSGYGMAMSPAMFGLNTVSTPSGLRRSPRLRQQQQQHQASVFQFPPASMAGGAAASSGVSTATTVASATTSAAGAGAGRKKGRGPALDMSLVGSNLRGGQTPTSGIPLPPSGMTPLGFPGNMSQLFDVDPAFMQLNSPARGAGGGGGAGAGGGGRTGRTPRSARYAKEMWH